MTAIKLDQDIRAEAAQALQRYLAEELDVSIGGFDAEFLLDLIIEQLGSHFYNQGLADAMTALEGKMEEFSEVLSELQQPAPMS